MCIFCKIVNGEIPSYKLYEDELVIAFLDISQTTKGHTLVIPKKHYDNILEVDQETLNHLIKVTQQIGKHLIEKLDAKGLNILSNVNEIAGQSVYHCHIHLIPRYSNNDNFKVEMSENNFDLNSLAQTLLIK